MTDHVETTLPVLIFTVPNVPGDVHALGRLVVDNDGATDASVIFWGVQQRNYSAAATAALYYEAETCALGSGASLVAGPAGASGAGSNVVQHTAVIGDERAIDIGNGSVQTHIGLFRVWARVRAPAANTGVFSVSVHWQPYVGAATIENTPVELRDGPGGTVLEDTWLLLDLGLINIPKASVGTQGWTGYLNSNNTVGADILYYDYIVLQPCDEGSGVLGHMPSGIVSGQSARITHNSAMISASGGYWRTERYIGDYVRIPPAGAEGLTSRVLVYLATGGALEAGPRFVSSTVPDISAKLFVTPRYLT